MGKESFRLMQKSLLTSILLFLLALQFSCSHKSSINSDDIVVMDSVSYDKILKENNWLDLENFEIHYIGEQKDTIYTNPFPNIVPPPPPGRPYGSIEFNERMFNVKELNKLIENHTYEFDSNSTIGTIYSDSIKILVDTSQVIGKYSYQAFPIIIKNSFCDTIRVGYSYNKRIVGMLEAMDKNGNWRPIIEKSGFHGLPVNDEIFLKKNEIIISAVYKYSGDFKTKLRFRIGKSCSNIYYSTINYNQFESIFDDFGNYKKEYLQWKKKNAR